MPDQPPPDVTSLLRRVEEGDIAAQEELLSRLYDELHERALHCLREQPRDHTLQATALVHEAYVRLVGEHGLRYRDSVHLLSVASRAMRHVLVDHARARNRQKRRAVGREVPLDFLLDAFEEQAHRHLEQLHEALLELEQFDAEAARGVELRFFLGLSVEETARLLCVSKRTFERRWSAARAWLQARLESAK